MYLKKTVVCPGSVAEHDRNPPLVGWFNADAPECGNLSYRVVGLANGLHAKGCPLLAMSFDKGVRTREEEMFLGDPQF
ncbi:MAG: hypothetical protein JWN14_306 [Chthonomonadales bacterium]|nr:hypothetical protein [Chthonomonadales bacterium]